MKNKILIAVLSLLIATPLLSQNKEQKQNTPEMRAEKMTNDMTRELNLTEEQREALYEANLRKTKVVPDNTQVARDAEDRYDADLKEIFTDEQYTSYLEKKAQQREKTKNKSKNKRLAPAREELREAPESKQMETIEEKK